MGRKPGKYSQAARVLRILDRIRGRRQGVPFAELASLFTVSEAQVRRDLMALEEAGYALEYTLVDGRSAVRLHEPNSRGVPVTRRERFTLLAMRRIFDVLRDTPFHEDLESLWAKLHDACPASERSDIENMRDRVLFVSDGGRKDYGGKEDVLDALQTGVMTRRLVRFAYSRPRGGTHAGVLAPYALAVYRQGLYVVGRSAESIEAVTAIPDASEKPRVFAVERFASAEYVPRTTFELPKDLRLAEIVEGSFGIHFCRGEQHSVAIEFSPARRAHVLGRIWHPTQRLTEQPDGGVLVEFSTSNLTEVVSWVLSWGPHARVVGPIALVERVACEARAAGAQYVLAEPVPKAA